MGGLTSGKKLYVPESELNKKQAENNIVENIPLEKAAMNEADLAGEDRRRRALSSMGGSGFGTKKLLGGGG